VLRETKTGWLSCKSWNGKPLLLDWVAAGSFVLPECQNGLSAERRCTT